MSYITKPWKHQETAVNLAKDKNEFAFFFEPGCGKTSTCINVIRYKFSLSKKSIKTLILCPPIVIDNWKREFAMHSRIPESDIILLTGPGKERLATLQKYWGDKIFITNYESLLMPDLFAAFLKWSPEILVLDESHKCKDISSQRTKKLLKLSPLAKYKFLLTGTPVLNSYLDLFSQFKIMDGGETLGANFFAFRSRYFYDKNAGMPKQKYFPNWVENPLASKELRELIAGKSMHAAKSECLDLPPLLTQNFYIELSAAQKKSYESMKKDFVAYLGSKACVATLALTKGLRLMQIVSGFLTVEGENGENRENITFGENPRADALRELLSEITLHSKVLVWAVFKQNYQTIRDVCDSLKLNFVEVHGDVSAEKKQENVKTFNEDPDCRVLIGHPGSGGIGINLVAASYSIFYSRNFSLEQDLQAEARNYRGGSEVHAKITRINLIAKNTIDEVIADALRDKVQIGEKILKKIAEEIT